jgi:hypothetical protein
MATPKAMPTTTSAASTARCPTIGDQP